VQIPPASAVSSKRGALSYAIDDANCRSSPTRVSKQASEANIFLVSFVEKEHTSASVRAAMEETRGTGRAFAAAKCLQILIAKLGDDHFGGHLPRLRANAGRGPPAMVETL